MQFWSEFFACPEIINWITRHSGSNICVWMINYPLYLIPSSAQFNLSRFWFRFVDGCPEIGIIWLTGSDLSFFLTCVWMIILSLFISFSSQFNYSPYNSDLDLLLVLQKIGLYGLTGGPIFPRHVGSFSVAQQFFLLISNIVIKAHQTSSLCLSLSFVIC